MNILFVSHEWEIGGSTMSMVTTINALKEQYNCNIQVLVPRPGPVAEKLKENNIEYKVFYYLNNYRRINKKEPCLELVKEIINSFAVFRIKKYLNQNQFDYVISNSSASDVGARAAIALGIKHIYIVREFMEEDFDLEYRNKKRMKPLFEKSDKIVFISNCIKEKYTALYHLKNYRVIYNAVIPKVFYIANHEILQDTCINFIQIGRICDGKGSKATLELLNKIKDEVKCHLTFVGKASAEYNESINEYINKHKLQELVSFVSFTNDVKSECEKADVLIMNSKSEGFGRVTVEGMLGGLLVIGRKAAGTAEIIEDEKIGVLFNSEEEFINSVREINANREKYRKIAEQGQKHALEFFAPERNARELMKYLLD